MQEQNNSRAREKRQKLKKFGLFLYIEKTIEIEEAVDKMVQ